jgi:hypothetical protein
MAKAPNTGEEMAEKVEVSYNVGGGFLGILTLIFITLKLTGYISWSWCWVLSPLWIPTFGASSDRPRFGSQTCTTTSTAFLNASA